MDGVRASPSLLFVRMPGQRLGSRPNMGLSPRPILFIEQLTKRPAPAAKFELDINLNAAKAQNLPSPNDLLSGVDELMEWKDFVALHQSVPNNRRDGHLGGRLEHWPLR